MRRVFVTIATVLCLLATACGADSVVAGGEQPPAPPIQPAPTVAGQVVVPEQPAEFVSEPVLVGISADRAIEVRALPGLDQPLAGEVAPGGQFDLTGEAFETEDGSIWWQLKAGNVQGWVQPQVAYSGPATDVTNDVRTMIGQVDPFSTPDELADLVARAVAADQGASQTAVVAKTSVADQYSSSITVDVYGFEDDSVFGYRLIIAANGRSPDGVDLWSLSGVTQLLLCSRGVSTDGLCI